MMGWSNEITLWCDGEECGEWTRITVSKVTYARNRAERGRGWDTSRSEDLCPDCKGGD